MMRISCPRRASAFGREPATSAKPPTFERGLTSTERKRTFMVLLEALLQLIGD
jgi:hypothetical protein